MADPTAAARQARRPRASTRNPGGSLRRATGSALIKDISPLRRRLGIELRRLRHAAAMSAADAAERLELSASTISRVETGAVSVHPTDVAAMLRLYGLHNHRRRQALLALARRARKQGWWHAYRDVLPADVMSFIHVEDAADSIRSFQTMLIPGLLQTPDYNRALAAAFPTAQPPHVVEKLIEVRRRRQQLLDEPNPVPMHVVFDESALRREIGGRTVMRHQLEHLLELAHARRLTLQVLHDRGAHVGLGGPFTIFGFPEPMDDLAIVHVENQQLFFLAEDENDIRHYEAALHRVRMCALPTADSLGLIAEIAETL